MINLLGSKLVPASQIEISEHITHDILKTLMLRPPLLKDARDLMEEAIKAAILLSPPIIYEKKNGSGSKIYVCVGDFRSLELARRFPASLKIRVNLIEPPLLSELNRVVLMLNMSSDLALALDPGKAGAYFSELRVHAINDYPEALALISPKCRFKKSFLEAIGLNRRKH